MSAAASFGSGESAPLDQTELPATGAADNSFVSGCPDARGPRPGDRRTSLVVAERRFDWLARWRRLNRNHKHTLGSARATVQVALIGIMARRLAKSHK